MVAPEFLLQQPHHLPDHAGPAVDQAGLHGGDRVRPDDALRRPELHPRQTGRPAHQRFGGDAESGSDRSAPVFPFPGDHVERQRGPGVQNDGVHSVEVMDRHGVGDAVGAGLLRRVHGETDSTGGLVVQYEERGAEVAIRKVPQDLGSRGHHAGRRQPEDVLPGDPGPGEETVEERCGLVGEPLRLGGNPPVADPALAVVEADGGLGVADVEDEEHGQSPNATGIVTSSPGCRWCGGLQSLARCPPARSR